MTEHIHKSVIGCAVLPAVEAAAPPTSASSSEAGVSSQCGPAPALAAGAACPDRALDVLVVDDEQTLAHVIRGILEEHGCRVRVAHSAEEGLALLARESPSIALVDIVLPGMNGLEFLARIKEASPDTEVLIMTSHASVETAVQAIRQGAYDYLQKPFDDVEDVWITVSRASEKRDLLLRNRALLLEAEVRNRELASAVMRLTSLTQAGRAMGHYQSLPALLDFVLGLVTRELDVDRASLMLIEEGTEHLRIVACRGMDSIETDKVRVRLGEGIAGSVAMTGTPFLVTDMTHDPRIAKPLTPGLSGSFISTPIVLSMPIKSREAILGVINVTNRRSGEPFTPEDLAYLTGLAGQLAVAVEGTRHFSNLKKAYESLKAAQERIVRSERLKAIGEMAAGVAHDFNNALSVLMGKAQAVRNKLAAEPIDLESACADLETMRKVSEQAAGTIRRIQDYTRIRKDVSSAPVDLDLVVRDAVEITRHKWKTESGARSRPIELVLELHELPPVPGNAQELAQAVGNLIFNAVEAMPDGGTLTLRTFAEEDRVVLEVEDTGIGMPPEVQEHLFEPFFTTKENGQGSAPA